MKAPWWRYPGLDYIEQSKLDQLHAGLETFVSLLPFNRYVKAIEIVGSYAKNTAELHSDMDVNVVLGRDFDAALKLLHSSEEMEEKFRQAQLFKKRLSEECGLVLIEVAYRQTADKDDLRKQVFDVLTRRWFNKAYKQVYTADYRTTRTGLQITREQPRHKIVFALETYSPEEIAFWARREGYQHVGSTRDTEHMQNANNIPTNR